MYIDEACWASLRAFVAEWHRPLEPGDGLSDAEIEGAEAILEYRLPRSLREFYLIAGKRDDLTRRYNYLLPPDRLEKDIDEWTLTFWHEGEDYFTLSLTLADMEAENPPVWTKSDDSERHNVTPRWERVADGLSDWFVFMVALETATVGDYRVIGQGGADAERSIKEVGRPVILPPMRGPFEGDRFYSVGRAFVMTRSWSDAIDLWVSARDQQQLEKAISEIKKVEWNEVSTKDE